MTQQPKIPSITEAYAAREPNELEKYLAEQKKPGYIPPGMEASLLASRLRALPQSDPRRILAVRKQINKEELTADDYTYIFGPDPNLV